MTADDAVDVHFSLRLLDKAIVNFREWTDLESAESRRAVENRGKMEENGCEIICGVPTTLAVKG